PSWYPDSPFYAGSESWSLIRPLVAIAFWHTVGTGSTAVLVLHTLSILAWARLGWAALGTPGVALALSIASIDLFRSWQWAVMAESLGLSGQAWLMAEMLLLRQGKQASGWRAYMPWTLAALLVTGRMETSGVLVACAWGAGAGKRRWPLGVCAALL